MPRRFVDTNIIIYAAGGEHPLKASCVAVLRWVAQGTWEGVTSAEVLQELLYLMDRRNQRDVGIAMAREVLAIMTVLPVTAADVQQAMTFMEGVPALMPYDALHAAVMQGAGITEIISADKHFDAVPGIRRLDPAALRAAGTEDGA